MTEGSHLEIGQTSLVEDIADEVVTDRAPHKDGAVVGIDSPPGTDRRRSLSAQSQRAERGSGPNTRGRQWVGPTEEDGRGVARGRGGTGVYTGSGTGVIGVTTLRILMTITGAVAGPDAADEARAADPEAEEGETAAPAAAAGHGTGEKDDAEGGGDDETFPGKQTVTTLTTPVEPDEAPGATGVTEDAAGTPFRATALNTPRVSASSTGHLDKLTSAHPTRLTASPQT